MYEGHIVPSSVFRHAPSPLHISTAPAKLPSGYSKYVGNERATYDGPNRKLAVSGGASTIFPGLKMPFGSNVRLIVRNAS